MSTPSQVPKLKSETVKIEGSQKRQGLRQAAVVDRQVGDASSGGVSRMWTKEPLLEKVDISCAQGALSANNSWSRADAAASLHHLQKAAQEASLWKLWECTCCVLSRHGSRPSEISFAKRCRPRSRLTSLQPAPCGSKASYRCQFPGTGQAPSSCGRPLMSRDIAAAIASGADGVSCTALGAGPR